MHQCMEIGFLQKRERNNKLKIEEIAQNKTLEIERVERYKYLGSMFHEEGGN